MTTPQLYDDGEEFWELKIHAGCGSIFLEGYVNIDIQGHPASERPDLVEANRATILDYYARRASYTDIHHIPPRAGIVVDRLADITRLPYGPCSVDKIVCIQTLEHLSPRRAELTLRSWWEILGWDRPVVLSVPNTMATVEMLLDKEARDFAVQHLAGTRRDEWSRHRNWFTSHSLELLLTRCGFQRVRFLENFHRYPALVARAWKLLHEA